MHTTYRAVSRVAPSAAGLSARTTRSGLPGINGGWRDGCVSICGSEINPQRRHQA